MIFTSDEAIDIIKANLNVSKRISDARSMAKELRALVLGKDFHKELIYRIEKLENEEKAIARKKYSRSIKDFFQRLLRPVDNVYTSLGGSKIYDIDSDTIKTQVVNRVNDIRGGKTLEGWLQTFWMNNAYVTDPNGVIFLEYGEGVEPYPTYKAIESVRNYLPNGQKCEWILFEPKKLDDTDSRYWRFVDDVNEFWIKETGESFVLVDDLSFQHPFGEVPALINSDIIRLEDGVRLSPIDNVLEASKEYARDLSIKTIYKFQNGFPIHWRKVSTCRTCHGTGKKGDSACPDCNGKGVYLGKDVTDIVTVPLQTGDNKVNIGDIAGYIAPDLTVWDQYTKELTELEETISKSHWGAIMEAQKVRTATEVVADVQPVIMRLNAYADVAQTMEAQISNWLVNFFDPTKNKEDQVVFVNYGRRYIIEPTDVILDKYEKSRLEGVATTILDRLFSEYLISKFKTDPISLKANQLKAEVEPYLHYTVREVFDIFGRTEAQKKALFGDWWESLDQNDLDKSAEALKAEYSNWISGQIVAPDPQGSEPIDNQ
jgi:hypothetical protein